MTSGATQEMASLVEQGIVKLPFEAPYIPWTIARIMNYTRMIKNAYQRAAYDKEPERALPPKWYWLSPRRVDAWFKMRREQG